MQRTVGGWFAASACLFAASATNASAHVKWFLGRSESEILRQPKPELFIHPCLENVLPILLALVVLFASTVIGRDLARSLVHRFLTYFSSKWEPSMNLLIGLCTGGSLMYCAVTRTLLAPNFIICAHCPWWLAPLECLTGALIAVGLFSRVAAVMLLGLLAFTFLKHTLGDCLDLVPLYGLALYFLIAGRNRFSADHFFGIESGVAGWLAQNLAHMSIRLCTGLGLLILGFDEKLVHPQLALELLKHSPSLNFMHAFGMSNDLFILCAGLSEVMLGLILIVGSFPRLAVLMLASVFAVTTVIFGTTELVGHLAYYGIIASILTRGAGAESPLSLLSSLYSLILFRLRRPRFGTIA